MWNALHGGPEERPRGPGPRPEAAEPEGDSGMLAYFAGRANRIYRDVTSTSKVSFPHKGKDGDAIG